MFVVPSESDDEDYIEDDGIVSLVVRLALAMIMVGLFL